MTITLHILENHQFLLSIALLICLIFLFQISQNLRTPQTECLRFATK